jgi:hypothetical protein
LRGRYIGAGNTNTPADQQILGLSAFAIDNDEINIYTDSASYSTASAEAFFQAFYPPYSPLNITGAAVDPTLLTANQTYVEFPLNGYQYPDIQSFSQTDPNGIWLVGGETCLNWDISSQAWLNSQNYANLLQETLPVYEMVGQAVWSGVFPSAIMSLNEGNLINDYLQFQYRHNATVYHDFSDGGEFAGMVDWFASLASIKEWGLYGDLEPYAQVPGDSIMAIGGRTLAAKIVDSLSGNLVTGTQNDKLTVMVGEFEPMMSLFSLLGLGNFNDRFSLIPPFGSSLIFELYSYNSSAVPGVVPDDSDLYVRFYFRNASDPTSSDPSLVSPDIQAYPIFGRGPSGTPMPWSDFKEAMAGIYIGLEDWCLLCQSPTLFCAAFLDNTYSSAPTQSSKHISPAVGGVIGAIVTLAVAGLLFAAAVLFGGLRFHRREKSSLGGYKGSDKLASDADLNIPKNAAPFGLASAGAGISTTDDKKGHERVGSWELKGGDDAKADPHDSLGSTVAGDARPSFEHDDEVFGAPVRPRESL